MSHVSFFQRLAAEHPRESLVLRHQLGSRFLHFHRVDLARPRTQREAVPTPNSAHHQPFARQYKVALSSTASQVLRRPSVRATFPRPNGTHVDTPAAVAHVVERHPHGAICYPHLGRQPQARSIVLRSSAVARTLARLRNRLAGT